MAVGEFVPPPFSDRCPEGCLYGWDEAEVPKAVALWNDVEWWNRGEDGWCAAYVCSHCGHRWFCSWGWNAYGDGGIRYMHNLMATLPAGEHAVYLKNQMTRLALRTLARKRLRQVPVRV